MVNDNNDNNNCWLAPESRPMKNPAWVVIHDHPGVSFEDPKLCESG